MRCIILFLILTSNVFLGQNPDEHSIKLGKYTYRIFLEEGYNYELNYTYFSINISHKNKTQNIGTRLTFRENNTSDKYKTKIDESHPPDPRSFLRDGIIIGEGEIVVDKNNKTITHTFSIYEKEAEHSYDKRIQVYKQKKDGFFELIQIKEYYNGIEKTLLDK